MSIALGERCDNGKRWLMCLRASGKTLQKILHLKGDLKIKLEQVRKASPLEQRRQNAQRSGSKEKHEGLWEQK